MLRSSSGSATQATHATDTFISHSSAQAPVFPQTAAITTTGTRLVLGSGGFTAMSTLPKSAPETPMARPIRDVETLAKSLFRDMTSQGFDKSDIVNLATALLDQITTQMHTEASRD